MHYTGFPRTLENVENAENIFPCMQKSWNLKMMKYLGKIMEFDLKRLTGCIYLKIFSRSLGDLRILPICKNWEAIKAIVSYRSAIIGGLYWIWLVFSWFCHSVTLSDENFRHIFLRNCDAYEVETSYTHGKWMDVCLFFPLFLHFSFSPIFKHLKFVSHFPQELWGLQS